MTMPAAMKRYIRRLMGTMTVYAFTLVAVNWVFRHAPPAGPMAYLVAILPALPIMAVFVVIGRLLVEIRDEYLRMMMVRHSLIATGLTLSITTGWGFLEGFGLVDHVPGYFAATIWFSALGAAVLVNRLIERRHAA